MDAATIGLLSLVLGLIGAVVGAFAYLVGDIRKMGAVSKRDLEAVRESITARMDNFSAHSQQERNNLRLEFVAVNQRVETDVRKLGETMVRREDVASLEQRITRNSDRLERKFDALRFGGNRSIRDDNNDGGV